MYTRYFLTEQFDRSRPVFYINYERTNERTKKQNDSKTKIIILLLAILSSIGIIIG